MEKVSRRTFMKIAAVTVSACALSSEMLQASALAEEESTSESLTDEIKVIRTGCRGCGKYECGVWVTVQNERAVKIEGDTSYPGSMGNCCSKSQASLQACYHPDRLRWPMKRTNPKSEDPGWVRISWDEALDTGVKIMGDFKEQFGGASLTFFGGTSRIYAMSGMSAMAFLYDSPNIVSPSQVCKGPRGRVANNTSHREMYFVENVWRQPVFVQWGSGIEVSNYDDAGRVAVDNASHADVYINIDCRMSNLAKEADYFLQVRPGTDAAIAMCWTKIIMENELFNSNYVRRWTNASFLVCEDIEPNGWEETYPNVGLTGPIMAKRMVKTILLKESDLKEDGDPKKFIVWDEANKRFTYLDANTGLWEGEGTFQPQYTDWNYVERAGMADKYDWKKSEGSLLQSGRLGIGSNWLPNESSMPTVKGQKNQTLPCVWSEGNIPEVILKDGRTVKVRTVFDHYHDNCKDYTPEHTSEVTGVAPSLIEESCLAYAQLTKDNHGMGAINYAVTHEHTGNAMKLIHTMEALDALMGNIDTPGGHRGHTRCPSVFENQTTLMGGQFLRVGTKNRVTDITENEKRICSFPLHTNADATETYDAMVTGEPYPIKGGLTQAGGMLNQTNLHLSWDAVKNLEFYTNWNLWHDPISDLADIILPEAHWLEVECSRVAQGCGGYYGAHIQCVDMPADVKWGIDIVGEWYKKAGVEFWADDPDNAWEMGDYLRDKAVASTGMTWQEYRTKFLEEGWFDARQTNPDGYGSCRRYETGWLLEPFQGKPGFTTATTRHELWSTGFEGSMSKQIEKVSGKPYGTKYALPYYIEPKSSPHNDDYRANNDRADYTPNNYPFILSTGRRIPVYFHSEHRQLPWCREVWPVPRLEMNPLDAEALGLAQGDWAWIETPFGKIRQCVDLFAGVLPGCANAEHSWWFPELNQPGHGFELSGCNCLVDAWAQCEGIGAPQLRGYLANIYKATSENSPFGNPIPCGNDGAEIIHDASDPRLSEWLPLSPEMHYRKEE